jgi:hypothetical protein
MIQTTVSSEESKMNLLKNTAISIKSGAYKNVLWYHIRIWKARGTDQLASDKLESKRDNHQRN